MFKKSIFALLIFCSVSTTIFAQGGALKGKITAKDTNEPVPFATITVLQIDEKNVQKIIDGTAADSAGSYKIKKIPVGCYTIKITNIGFKEYNFPNVCIEDGKNTKLSVALKKDDASELGTVTIVENKAVFQNDIDKKVYNVAQDLTSEGATTLEALGNVPSVSVDIDGNVAMRGSGNVRIWIDGRPVKTGGKTDILNQIPASAIDRIELITNPSAKYDADGTTGIINIILKKDAKIGFNTMLQATAATGNKYGISVAPSFRTKQWNVYGGYSYNYKERWNTALNERKFGVTRNGALTTTNTTDGKLVSKTDVARFGVDWMPDDLNTIGVSGIFSYDLDRNNDAMLHKQYNDTFATRNLSNREIVDLNKNTNYAASFYYKHSFKSLKNDGKGNDGKENDEKTTQSSDKKDKKAEKFPFLEINANYTKDYEADSSRYTNTEITNDYKPTTLTLPNLQERPEFIWGTQTVVKIDYTMPFGKKNKWEIGGHYTEKSNDDDYQFWGYARGINEWLADSSRLNRFVFNSQVYSAYTTYSNMIGKKFGYELGARFDQTNTNGALLNKKEVSFVNNYFTWFPTLHLIYKLNKGEDLRLSYTRRTNRPSNSQLNPTVNYSNPYLLKQGNIRLQPEFTHSSELSYSKEWENHSISVATYYKYSDNQIARQVTYDSIADISTVTYQNAAKRTNYGAELVAKNQICKWWNFITTANVYYTEFINDFAVGGASSNSGYGYDAKLISQMKWGSNSQLQIVGNYNSPRILAQGRQQEQWSVNLGFRQYFLDRKLSIGLNVQDVFNSLHTESFTNIEALQFSQRQDRKKESRIAMLTLTYRFGAKPAERKAKNETENDEQHELKNDVPDVD